MNPELFNKDIVFEISNYLLHFDLRNLIFAFPGLKLTENIYLNRKSISDNRIIITCSRTYFSSHLLSIYGSNKYPDLFPIERIESNSYFVHLHESIFETLIKSGNLLISQFSEFKLLGNYKLTIRILNSDSLINIAHKHKLIPDLFFTLYFFDSLHKCEYIKFLIKQWHYKYQNTLNIVDLIKLETSDFEIFSYYYPDKILIKQKIDFLYDKIVCFKSNTDL